MYTKINSTDITREYISNLFKVYDLRRETLYFNRNVIIDDFTQPLVETAVTQHIGQYLMTISVYHSLSSTSPYIVYKGFWDCNPENKETTITAFYNVSTYMKDLVSKDYKSSKEVETCMHSLAVQHLNNMKKL